MRAQKSWAYHLGISSASWTLSSVSFLGSLCKGAHEPAGEFPRQSINPFSLPWLSELTPLSAQQLCPPGLAACQRCAKCSCRSADPSGPEWGLGKCQLIIFSEQEWCSGKRERGGASLSAGLLDRYGDQRLEWMPELVMTEQILDHGSLSGPAPRGWGVCRPQEGSRALGSLYL